jgi:MerR family gold-responsive transcriptional activator of gol and ges genes
MNIGEASKTSGVSAKMIRYYEDIELIPPAARSESGYRAYTWNDVHRLRFIRRARDLGFSVAEIGELLGLWNDRSRQSADVKRLAQAHIVELENRIRNLRQMADALQQLIGCCAGDDRPDCPILATLEDPAEEPMQAEVQSGIPTRDLPRGNAFAHE